MVVGQVATLLSGIMALLYLIPGSGCTFTYKELIIAAVWGAMGIVFAIICRIRFGNNFGIEENAGVTGI